MTKFQAGDKVQLSAAYLKLPISRYDNPSHFEAFKAGAGIGTVTEVFRSGMVAVQWENGFSSGCLHPRFAKFAR